MEYGDGTVWHSVTILYSEQSREIFDALARCSGCRCTDGADVNKLQQDAACAQPSKCAASYVSSRLLLALWERRKTHQPLCALGWKS